MQRWMLVVVVAGCHSTTIEEHVDCPAVDAAPIVDSPPDAQVCQGVACGVTGQDPCCAGASCADFGDFGAQQCAMACTVNADCATGACVPGRPGTTGSVCAPIQWAGIGGIEPEKVCREAVTCAIYTDEPGCNTFFQGADDNSGCLGSLTQLQLEQWVDAADTCLKLTSCAAVTPCFDNLPLCTFSANVRVGAHVGR